MRDSSASSRLIVSASLCKIDGLMYRGQTLNMALFQLFESRSLTGGFIRGFLVISGILSIACPGLAQTIEQGSAFVSREDEDLTIRKVTVLPVSDNLDGIYARPIESHLVNLVRNYHKWDFIESNLAGGPNPTANELEESPETAQRIARAIDTDALFSASASKGPNGLSIKLNLLLKSDGRLLAQEILKDHPRFEIPELKEQVQTMFRKVVRKIPYDGLVVSRQQNRVTLNLGKSDGITKDQILTAILVIKGNRHPKFGFLINTEKEILGKIKVLKVDDTLSFGAVVSEKDKGAIKRFTKVSGLDNVNYTEPEDLSGGLNGVENVNDRPDADMSFGKSPKEWLPVRPPSFGQAGLKIGLGSYASATNLSEAGTLEAKSTFYPSLALFGELWINPNWQVRADIFQGVLSTPNPRSGSTPSTLNHSISRYSLTFGYNFLLQNDFFGPKLQVRTGFLTYRSFVDDSTPRGLTTVNYSGYLIGLGASLPISEDKVWYLGGLLNLVLFPKVAEQPVSSGGAEKNSINDFALFVEKKISENLRAIGSLDFSLYSTSFGTTGSTREDHETASSLSQRHTILSAGIAYLF